MVKKAFIGLSPWPSGMSSRIAVGGAVSRGSVG